MTDDIRRWSDELARNPSSLVFLQLGEALRRQNELEIALKIALRGLERHPQNVDARDLVARIAVDRRDFARAFEEWEAVLALDPTHVGAMKGLGYLCFQYGRFADAERYLDRAAAGGGGSDIDSALEMVRRSSGSAPAASESVWPSAAAPHQWTEARQQATEVPQQWKEGPPHENGTAEQWNGVVAPVPHAAPLQDGRSADTAALPADPQWLFADLLVEDGQTALLLDANGYVLGGLYVDEVGTDLGGEIGAQLSGVSDEVQRVSRHLDLGHWQSITFETEVAAVAMMPARDQALLVVAVSRVTPLGLLRRLVERCADRADRWLSAVRGAANRESLPERGGGAGS